MVKEWNCRVLQCSTGSRPSTEQYFDQWSETHGTTSQRTEDNNTYKFPDVAKLVQKKQRQLLSNILPSATLMV